MAEGKVICDTDVIIDYWDAKQPRHEATKNSIENEIGLNNVTLSAITKMELLVGAANKNDITKINKQLGRFDIVLLNDEITNMAFDLLRTYTLSHGLAIPDGLIASTAIMMDIELFTYNIKDYKFIHKLRLFKS